MNYKKYQNIYEDLEDEDTDVDFDLDFWLLTLYSTILKFVWVFYDIVKYFDC